MQDATKLLVPGHVTSLVPGSVALEAVRHTLPMHASDRQLKRALAPLASVQVSHLAEVPALCVAPVLQRGLGCWTRSVCTAWCLSMASSSGRCQGLHQGGVSLQVRSAARCLFSSDARVPETLDARHDRAILRRCWRSEMCCVHLGVLSGLKMRACLRCGCNTCHLHGAVMTTAGQKHTASCLKKRVLLHECLRAVACRCQLFMMAR